MTWDTTWWWLVAYLAVGFVAAIVAVRYSREDELLTAVTTWLCWPVVVLYSVLYGVGVLIVALAHRIR